MVAAGSFSNNSKTEPVLVAASLAIDIPASARSALEQPHKFESVVPQVIRARDIHLKDHPIIEGAYAEYERLYNADSLMTVDGRPMVRLL
ncbi:hypothetical protein BGX31_000090 [Mortierella sp. GBA43]|nr:hypothetical protein BGX31_000090 [Mortierella sp. GBA43]